MNYLRWKKSQCTDAAKKNIQRGSDWIKEEQIKCNISKGKRISKTSPETNDV